MNFRARTIGLAMVAVAGGLIATGLPASASPAVRTGAPVSPAVEIVTPLPHGVDWADHAFHQDGKKVSLPAGYQYKDGGVLGPGNSLVYAPDSAHEGVVVTRPVACKGGGFESSSANSHNFISNIVNGAFKVAHVGLDAAEGIVQTVVGGGPDISGANC